MSRSWRWIACVCLLSVSCSDAETPLTPPDAAFGRAHNRAEALPGIAQFLPPVGAAGGAGDFDADLLSHLTIEVAPCSPACGAPVAVFTAAGSGAHALRLEGGHYQATWRTAAQTPGTYVATARVAGTVLARARLELKDKASRTAGFQVGSTVPLRLFVPVGAVHVIEPAGGVVEVGVVRLDFPAGAVPEPIGVTVRTLSGLPAPAGGSVVAGTTFELGPDGTIFDEDVRLTIRYDEAALGGQSEATLRLQRWGANGWEPVPGSTVDAAANSISGNLRGFSGYGVISYEDAWPTLSGWGTPTLDATISAGEWNTAGRVDFHVAVPEGGTVPATLYAMNDFSNVYFALVYHRPIPGAGEWVGVVFDEDDDGVAAPGDDAFGFEPQPDINDLFRSTACGRDYCDDEDHGGSEEGAGAFLQHSGFAVFEVSKPLSSTIDAAHDLNVAIGDTIGFFFALFLEDATQDDANLSASYWPGAWDDFAHLVLQPGPLPVLAGSGTAALDSVFGAAEYAAAACLFFDATQPDGSTRPAKACVMNDATNLYVAVQYDAGPPGTIASLWVNFDESGDGTIGIGDDLWLFDPSQLSDYQDMAWSEAPVICLPTHTPCVFEDTFAGGTHDGHGIYARTTSEELFELRHPLNSGDGWDVSLATGDLIGMNIVLQIDDGAGNLATTGLSGPTGGQLQVKVK